MTKTLLLSLGVLLLCTAAYAQPYTVTFTLTCDHGASGSLSTNPADPTADVRLVVVDQLNTAQVDCGSATLSCGPDRTSTQDCSGIGFLPARYTTSVNGTLGVGGINVTSKDGATNFCGVDNAVPSKNISCDGSGHNGAAISASKPH